MIQPIRPQDASGIYRQVGGAGAGNGGTGPSRITREAVAGAPTAPPRVAAARGRRADQVQISDRARQLRRVAIELAQTPDVRLDRVAELRAQIASGSYQIDPAAIAERMVQSLGGSVSA